ncbi:hypothetical protein ACWDR1_33890 [Streptosporangium sandarakinum]
MAARARSMLDGASGRPVLADGVIVRWVTYSVMVSAVAGSGRRPRWAHQAVKADQSAAYARRVESGMPARTASRAASLTAKSAAE